MTIDTDSISAPEHNKKQHGTTKDRLSELSLGSTLFQCMKKYSNRILQYIAETDENDTYGDFLTRCIRTALKFKEKGVTRNDIISTCTHNQKNAAVPIIAALFIGAKTANFDPEFSPLDATHLLKLVQPKIIFVSQESVPLIEKCIKESEVDTEMVVFDYSETYPQFSEYLLPNSEEENFKPVTVDDSKETAAIIFSSGTTGLPKGICLSHYSLLGQSLTDHFWTGNEVPPFVSLIYYTLRAISSFVLFVKLVSLGGSRVICSKFEASNTWKLIEKYKIGVLFLAPYHVAEFLAHRDKNINTDSLYQVYTGSTTTPKKLMDGLREILPKTGIFQTYGLTEVAGVITVFNGEKPKDFAMQITKPLSCGKITQGHQYKIVDTTTEKTLGPNQRGELRIKSDYVMNGYYKMDSSSEFDSDGYLKTGDIAYIDDEDCFYIIDRIKEAFKYKAFHILPAVLEEVLTKHPAVKEAMVIGIPHETDGDYPMGIVVLNNGYEDVTPEEIEQYANEKLAEVQRLRAGVKIVKEFVRTTTDKANRSAMKQMVMDGLI